MTRQTSAGHRLALRRWLVEWARCIRAADYHGARALFADDVTGFGTYAAVAHGRGALERKQWRHVWPHTDGFRFALRGLHCELSADGRLAMVWVRWSSNGRRASGAPFRRPGRATIFLRREAGRWYAFHTHFSLVPGTPEGPLTTTEPARARVAPRTRRGRAAARRPRRGPA